MTEEPEDTIRFSAEQRGLLMACAIVGLWLLAFWFSYNFGTGIGHDIFGSTG